MFCPHCGNQSAEQARFCSSCGSAIVAPQVVTRARLVRPRSPRMIAGICSGVAIYYGWDLAVVRILFAVFTCLTSGLGVIVYLVAWVAIPDAQYALPAQTQRQGNAV